LPEPYFEKVPFPAKVKEHSTLVSVLNKSTKKAVEPDEQIIIKSPVAIVKDLVVRCIYLYIVVSPYVRGFPGYLHMYLYYILWPLAPR
jgi:hypothetical protein